MACLAGVVFFQVASAAPDSRNNEKYWQEVNGLLDFPAINSNNAARSLKEFVTTPETFKTRWVSIKADHAGYHYTEGQNATFTVMIETGPVHPDFGITLEGYFPDMNRKVDLQKIGEIFMFTTPALQPGSAAFVIKAYLENQARSAAYVRIIAETQSHIAFYESLLNTEQDPVKRQQYEKEIARLQAAKQALQIELQKLKTLVQEETVSLSVRYDDDLPPTLTVTPGDGANLSTSTPLVMVEYTDNRAGVDASTLKVEVIPQGGPALDVTSNFTITDSSASFQFTDAIQLPLGDVEIRTSVSDRNGNQATKSITYHVDLGQITQGYIEGIVSDTGGNSIEGATANTQGGAIGKTHRAITGPDGKFKIPFTQGGDFIVNISKSGFTSQQRQVTAVNGRDASVEPLTLKTLDPQTTSIQAAAGGTAQNSSGNVQLDISANAASQDMSLNITQYVAGGELPNPLPLLSEFTFAASNEPDGVTFSTPAAVKLKNTLGFPAGATLVYGNYSKAQGRWLDSGRNAVVSGDGQWINFDLDHFSAWDTNQPVAPPTTIGPRGATEGRGGLEGTYGSGWNAGDAPSSPQTSCAGCRIDIRTGNLGTDYVLPPVMRLGEAQTLNFSYNSLTVSPAAVVAVREQLLPGASPDNITVSLTKQAESIFRYYAA